MVEEPQTIDPTAEKARIIEQMLAIAHSDIISNSRKECIIDLIVNNHHIIDAVSKWYVAYVLTVDKLQIIDWTAKKYIEYGFDGGKAIDHWSNDRKDMMIDQNGG